MGTTYHITVVPTLSNISHSPAKINPQIKPTLTQAELAEGIAQVLDDVNQSMSTYISDSELSILNDDLSGEWLPVSAMLAHVLSDAIFIGDLSNGALDITVGPLVNLWGFGPGNMIVSAPSDVEINAVEKIVGLKKLLFDSKKMAIKKPLRMRIDLSSIAKGYGADAIAGFFIDNGYENFLVEVGGELVTSGHNAEGQLWRIGVEKPALGHDGVQQAIGVSGKGIATSGDYRNYFEQDGVRFSHIIDPRTGRPVNNDLASVTVIADTGAVADGLATAFTVMGAEASLALAREHNIAIYVIIRRDTGFVVDFSPAFAPYLDVITKP